MSTASTESRICPDCGASVAATAQKCWMCGRAMAVTEVAVDAQVVPAPVVGRTFGLNTLFLFMTLCAVWAGVTAMAPGLGIMLAVLSVPALLRTRKAVGLKEQATGDAPTSGEKAVEFVGSLGIAFVVFFASVTAFCLTCFPIGLMGFRVNGEPGTIFILGVLAGGAVAGLVAYVLGRALWPRQKPPRPPIDLDGEPYVPQDLP